MTLLELLEKHKLTDSVGARYLVSVTWSGYAVTEIDYTVYCADEIWRARHLKACCHTGGQLGTFPYTATVVESAKDIVLADYDHISICYMEEIAKEGP